MATMTTVEFQDGSISSYNVQGELNQGSLGDLTNAVAVDIGDSVTSIGNGTFYDCSGLTSVTIPESVTSIGYQAFSGCSGLTSIAIPNNVTSIGGAAFYDCSGLTNVTIPDGVTSIGDFTFYNCTSLTSVTIGNSATSIGNNAFSGCNGLTSVTIPASVTSIGSGTFSRCSALSDLELNEGLERIGYQAFSGCNGLTSVTIPNSVMSIENGAFYNCTSLTNMTIPNGVTSIGSDAFSYCTSLMNVTIPDSVTSIGFGAFNSCNNVIVTFLNRTYNDVDQMPNHYWGLPRGREQIQIEEMSLYLYDIGLSTILSDNATFYSDVFVGNILSGAFNSCSNLTSIAILSAESIEDSAFAGCISAYEMTLPGLSVLNDVFGQDRSSISSLQTLSICDGIIDIGTNLSGLLNLAKLNIPSTISCLQYGALSNDAIFELSIPSSSQLCIGCFSGLKSLESLSISLDSVPHIDDIVNGDLGLSSAQNAYSIFCKQPSSPVVVGQFINGTNVQQLVFENDGQNIIELQESSFAECISLKETNLSNSTIQAINCNTFLNCKALSSVIFPSTLVSLSEKSFAGCDELNRNGFNIPDTVLTVDGPIGINIFNQIPNQLEKIGPSSFYDATFNLDDEFLSMSLSNIQSMGEYAFAGNCNLTSFVISSNVVPQNCFNNNQQIISIEISHNGPLYIEASAFYNCQYLNNCILSSEDQPTHIKEAAFAYNTQLTSIDLCNVVAIGPSAFIGSGLQNDGIDEATDVILLDSVLSIGKNAFASCSMTQMFLNKHFGGTDGRICCDHPIFNGCESLTYIYVDSTYDDFCSTCSSDSYVFPSISSAIDKQEMKNAWLSATNWFFDEDPDTKQEVVIGFNDYMLRNDGEITGYSCLSTNENATVLLSVIPSIGDFQLFVKDPVLPASINKIQEKAFDSILDNDHFTHISLFNVYDPGLSTFANSQYLTYVDAHNILSATGYMFSGTERLSSVSIDKARYICKDAFSGCINISSISGNNVHYIYENAFIGCEKLSAVDFQNVYVISSNAFYGCSSLVDASTQNAKFIGPSAFMGCNSMASIDISKLQVLQEDFLNGTGVYELSIMRSTVKINDSSLDGLTPQLKVHFIDRYPNDVDNSFISFKDNNCKVAAGTEFYTLVNRYKHPSYIAVSETSIVSIDPAFECKLHAGTNYVELISVDDNFLNRSTDVAINDDIGFISGISSNEIDAISFISNSTIMLDYEHCISQGVFSHDKNPNLAYIYATGINYKEHEAQLSGFWSYTSDNNNQLTVVFGDGDIIEGEFTANDDPFIRKKIGDEFVIYGIADNRVKDTHQTITKGNAISSFAFRSNNYAYELSNRITDLSVSDYANLSAISAYAFSLNTALTCISDLGNNLKYIDPTAFQQCGLKRIVVPSSLNDNHISGVSGYGLNDTITLTSLIYADGIESIAPSAMIDCQSMLAEISFPSTLTAIHDHAFAEMVDVFPRITNLNLSAATSLSSIDSYVFYNSISSLAENKLVLPSSLTSIGEAAFAYRRDAYTQVLSNLLQIAADAEMNENLLQIGTSAFMYNHFKTISFGINLSCISSYAFANPKYKQNLHMLSNIQSIGHNAFLNNIITNPDNIKANIICIDIPTDQISSVFGIEYISSDYRAFNNPGCTDGTVISATYPGNNPGVSFAFFNDGYMNFCPANISIDLISKILTNVKKDSNEIYVPSYLTAIGPSAFIDCVDLSSVSASSPISIGEYAFQNCSSLQYIMPTNNSGTYMIDNVEQHSFYNCQKLTNIQLLSSVAYINDSAFFNCKNISNYYDDDNLSNLQYFDLSSIGTSAFYGNESLTSFSIGPKIIQIGQNSFDNCFNLSSININLNHQAFLDVAKKQNYIDNFNDSLTIEQAVSSIFGGIRDDGQCYIKFTDITYMNNGIVKIDNEFVDIYEYGLNLSATSGVNQRFKDSNQRFLNLSGVTRVDDYAFQNENTINSMSFLPNSAANVGLSAIGDYAFYGCRSLMNFNDGTISSKTVGCYSFANCNALKRIEIDLPYLSSIGYGAFYGTQLNTLYVINCNTSIMNAKDDFQIKISYNKDTNPNPLELPEYCNIIFLDQYGTELGQFDYLFNDLTHATIDTNRNSMVFVDKMRNSVRPLLLVKQMNNTYLPAIVENSFHANIVGKWK